MIVEVFAVGVAILSLALSLSLAQRLAKLERSLATRTLPDSLAILPFPADPSMSPLEGLKIGVCIRQDHSHPVFFILLRELLLREDVADVEFLDPATLDEYKKGWTGSGEEADLLIAGTLTCNGYSDVYFQAELGCFTPAETIRTVVESPPSGDRQANLAKELVARLKDDLLKRFSRSERRSAIRELQGP